MFDPDFPLVLDVDGTLLRNDLTHDQLFALLGRAPLRVLPTVLRGLRDKSAMKEILLDAVGKDIDVESLPFRETVLAVAREHVAQGGKVILCSGSHGGIVERIGAHLDFVSECFGTSQTVNLIRENKAAFLEESYPEGFHYIGNSSQDIPVWKAAKRAAAVNPPKAALTIKTSDGHDLAIIEHSKPTLKTLAKTLRVHQWAKNGLIGLVPLLTFSALTPESLINIVLGFFALSFLASATYILNDLLDIDSDRRHHTKRNRPIPSGQISVPAAVALMAVLGFATLALQVFLPFAFTLILCVYLVVTLLYSFKLKKLAIVDVLVLAGLFTLRVIAGAALVDQPVSAWLLNFIATFFFSLALLKRYTEIRKKPIDAKLDGRGYIKDDEVLLLSLGIMSTGLAILSFLLYGVLAEDGVIRSQIIMFSVLTILTFWLMRAWFLAHRREMKDDPVLFAVTDIKSLVLGACTVALVLIEQATV